MNKWSEGIDPDRRSAPAKGAVFRNVPAPQRGPDHPASGKQGSAYTRFIPREELGSFSAWQPSSFRSADGSPPPNTDASAAAPKPGEWVARVDEARRQGAQEGYQNGYRDGLVALESFKQSLAKQNATQLNQLLQSIDDAVDALQPQLAQTVSQVAVSLAEQVLRTQLSLKPELVAEVAVQAVQAVLLSAKHITLHLHPQDHALVHALIQEGAVPALQDRGARVQAKADLARGDCLVETDLGSVDARVATRWAQATANLGLQTKLSDDTSDQVDNGPVVSKLKAPEPT